MNIPIHSYYRGYISITLCFAAIESLPTIFTTTQTRGRFASVSAAVMRHSWEHLAGALRLLGNEIVGQSFGNVMRVGSLEPIEKCWHTSRERLRGTAVGVVCRESVFLHWCRVRYKMSRAAVVRCIGSLM